MIAKIQLLRALAAILVVIFHIAENSKKYQFLLPSFTFGAIGVDIFFVISGFIMIYIQHIKHRNPFEFFVDRLTRIGPPYWALTMVFLVLQTLAPNVFRSPSIDWLQALTSILFVSANFDYKSPTLYVGWTLEYEAFFYVVFGICLIFKNLRTTAITTSCVLLLALYFGDYQSVLLDFLLGMVIAELYIRLHYRPDRRFGNIFALGLSLLALTLIFIFGSKYDEKYRFFYWGVPSALFFAAALLAPQTKSKLSKVLGDSSYSIYLIQVFTIPFCYKIASMSANHVNPYLFAILCCAFTVGSGVAFFMIFEKKSIKLLRAITNKKNNITSISRQ